MPLAEGKTAYADAVARALEERADGPVIYTANPLLDMLPRGFVYIFSVFPQPLKIEKGGVITLPACPAGAEVSTPYKIPKVVMSSYFDAASQSMKTDIMKGEDYAQDIIHPLVLTSDWSIGSNLEDYGAFWSRNERPTPAEIAKARGKLELTFRRELNQATMLETTDQLEQITPMMRLAASYFKEDRRWNKIYQKMEVCYACGGDVRAGVIIHSCGAVMPGRWRDAVMAGLKTKEQALAAGVDLDAKPEPPAGKGQAKAPKPPEKQ